jgi:DNA gyrase/topoisomerase IV subunit A
MRKFIIIFLLLVLTLFLACSRKIDQSVAKKEKEIAALKAHIAELRKENESLGKSLSEQKKVVEAQRKTLDAYKKFDKSKFDAMKARDINITLAKMRNIITALEMYFANNNKYPNSLEALQTDYISSAHLVDAWDNGFFYSIDHEHREFQLVSTGADGEIHTSDDVKYVKGQYLTPPPTY